MCNLTALMSAVIKVNTKKYLEKLMKEQDGWKTRCQEVAKDRDTWRGRCQEVARAILPVLDVISPELPETVLRAPQLGMIEKRQRAWGWL